MSRPPMRRPPALTPWPLRDLLGRAVAELDARGAIFDLPVGKWHRPVDGVDLADTVGGHAVGTPLGPAAGPHTQLAQNLVLSWLAGARTLELKTVQVLDELEIPRPCIDMAAEGYNVEWSQELRLDESLREYAKAALMIAVLRAWEPVRAGTGEPGGHVFELSCGYDLAGVRSAPMAAFLDSIGDARAAVDAQRGGIPPALAGLRDVEVPARLCTGATLSTFHGCPPDEIEAIVRHLMTRHGLDVTVKLNPTLLGRDAVAAILHDRLGYHDTALVPAAFAEDLAMDRALELVDGLAAFARAQGRRFGVKLTNTLVVANERGRLPGAQAYLSGAPLHVLAATLLAELDARLPGRLALAGRPGGEVPVSFSAGVERGNAAEVVALGLSPVTVCSDLLKPGGYGRLSGMLRRLADEMRAAGCADLPAWRARADAAAQVAGHASAAAAYAAHLSSPEGAAPYAAGAVRKPLKRTGRPLALFDCTSCHLCVTVCPNDAMIRLARPDGLEDRLTRRWQYLCLADLCNDCGNCTTFCPDDGAPHRVKPRLHVAGREAAAADSDYRVARAGGVWTADGARRNDLVAALLRDLPLPAEDPEPEEAP
ncbi:MAG: 4Fe-4S dicluster domain-containing protein [Candidatus Latescibacteria bacterium]|nr:4Fe-4S dicluster domain-containing protein [Candidatus Latescibacterota bacterium]